MNVHKHPNAPGSGLDDEIDRFAARDHEPVIRVVDVEIKSVPMPPLVSEIGDMPILPSIVYSTGFVDLDDKLGGGISTRSLTVPVARTGAGKTGWVNSIAMYIMRKYGVPFLYASSEHDNNEAFARAGAHVLGVAHRDIEFGRVDRAEVADALRGLPFHVVERRELRRGAVKVITDRTKQIADHYGKAPLVAADFLQNMVADRDERAIRMGVTAIAEQLRDIASDLDVAMLAVSSTGRSFYKPPKDGADDPLTYLSAAKESGDVEYAASNIIFLDVATEHVSGVYPARMVIPKVRRGETGFVGYEFHGPSGRCTPKAESLSVLDATSRRHAANAKQDAEDDAKVVKAILGKPGCSWSVIRERCGLGKTRADASRDRHLAAGTIDITEQPFQDARGRVQRRPVVVLTTAPMLPTGGQA